MDWDGFRIFTGVSKLSGTKGSHEEMLDFMKTEIPLGKPQTTWDMGMTAVFLASDAARSISGDTIVCSWALLTHPTLCCCCNCWSDEPYQLLDGYHTIQSSIQI